MYWSDDVKSPGLLASAWLLVAGSVFGYCLVVDSLTFACVIKRDGTGKSCYTGLESMAGVKAGSLRNGRRSSAG